MTRQNNHIRTYRSGKIARVNPDVIKIIHKRHKIKIIVNKNMTNKEFMNADFDKDNIINSKDCRPFNKAMQHPGEGWHGVAYKRSSVRPKTYINYLTRAVGFTRASVLKGGKPIRYAKQRKLL